MYSDLLNTTCMIYRLAGLTDYDFSVSDEGEISENWELKYTDVKCRLDRRMSISRRRMDGVVETGSNMLFIESDVDLIEGDRIYANGKFYNVSDVIPVDGMRDLHHKEVVIQIIDWTEIS